jgi:hypothetical protein
MEELKKDLEDWLDDVSRDQESSVESWSAIEGEPATYGVELKTGDLFFIQVVPA